MARADRLRKDGWTECGTCGGYGYTPPDEEGWSGRCTDCAHGLVPPDGMVEAAANHMESRCHDDRAYVHSMGGGEKWRAARNNQARAALVGAARAGKGKEK